MAITLPAPGQVNWDVPLNDVLSELQQDITEGTNTYVSRVDADNTYARVNDARITNALQKTDNLASVQSKQTARVNLGLGNASTRDVGTLSGTVAAGDALPTHVNAADPHGDRAWATQTFLNTSGGQLSGALIIGSGGLTLQSGGLMLAAGNFTMAGNAVITGNTSQTGTITSYGFTVGSASFATSIAGDAQDRFRALSGGQLEWGDGTNGRDTNLYRSSANTLATDDDFAIIGSGKGLKVKEGGTAAKMGVVTLVGGTAVVSTTSVTTSSRIFLTNQSQGGTAGILRISAKSSGVSFTITSSSATDTSIVAWFLVEPA